MKPCPRFVRIALLSVALCTSATLFSPAPAGAQGPVPDGIVALVASSAMNQADVMLLDLASGRSGRLNAPIGTGSRLAWRPAGNMLAFATQDGGYGLLKSLAGCFGQNNLCQDVEIFRLPTGPVTDVVWAPGGDFLIFNTAVGLKIAPPRTQTPGEVVDVGLSCPRGFDVSAEPLHLICADEDSQGNVEVKVYASSGPDFLERHTVGVYPDITAIDIGIDGRAAVGTLETAGDSAIYSDGTGNSRRFTSFQIHAYALEFDPTGDRLAVTGATADSTGDGTLRDGDTAELQIFETVAGTLAQIPGFTGATDLTWSPDGGTILVVVDDHTLLLYTLANRAVRPIPLTLPPQADIRLHSPAWNPAEPLLPIVPTATPPQQPVGPPTLTFTPFPSPTPFPTPVPTFTPYPSPTPWPTFTPVPSSTPGSPAGVGCQYARVPQQVNIGDTAVVTQAGAAVRFRTAADLNAALIRELPLGTRMTILNGPFCAQGYRWWQVQLETDATVGFLADSTTTAYWIERAAPQPPPLPLESINFLADRYSINTGQCVTIWWAVEGIKEVFYQGLGVTGNESRIECPVATTTYALRVIRSDNSEVIRNITIFVTSGY